MYVELSENEHLTVPLRDRRRPPITKFEHDLAVKILRERGRQAVDEQSLFDMVNEQRRIVLEAAHKTKTARKSAQRIAYALEAGLPPATAAPSMALPVSSEPEDSAPIVPFQIEERL